MKSSRTGLSGLFAALVLVGVTSVSASAAPTPYPPVTGPGGTVASLTVTDGTPGAGGEETGFGEGFASGEQVSFDLHSTVVHLGNVTANAAGAVSLTFTVPSGFSGVHSLVLTGLTSGRVASASITVGDPTAAGGGLPMTGTNIAVTLLVAVVLVGGGVVITSSARRRRVLA